VVSAGDRRILAPGSTTSVAFLGALQAVHARCRCRSAVRVGPPGGFRPEDSAPTVLLTTSSAVPTSRVRQPPGVGSARGHRVDILGHDVPAQSTPAD